MKILIWVGVGWVVLAVTPFLLLFLSMVAMRLFAISEKKAKKELTDIINSEYGNAWSITKATRFFNEGNMNPNMFYMELEANTEPKVKFGIYWDAKLKKPKGNYGDDDYSFNSQYKRALEDHALHKAIEKAIGNEAKLEHMDYWKLKINTDKSEADFMLKMARTIENVIRSYSPNYGSAMDVIFTSEVEPDGFYKIEISLSEPKPNLYIDLNTTASNGKLDRIRVECLAALKPVLAEENPLLDLNDILVSTWVNQENEEQFYGVLQVTSQKVKGDERIGMQQYEGLMFFHFNILAGQVTEGKFEKAGKSIANDLEVLNSQLPDHYKKPE